jgi:glutathione synthase/RimK-type ligase-like ATP-grasp enzyme
VIAIISRPEDVHAATVLERLRRLGACARIVDLSCFPRQMALAIRYDDGGSDFALRLPDGSDLALAECRAIWWRRPQPFTLHAEIEQSDSRTFTYNECFEAFAGLWPALDAFWVNDPARDEVAAHKAYQLRVAQAVGLPIPETLITNDPQQARAFAERRGHGRTIYKAFSATEQHWRETRLLRPEELALLDSVRYAPVIFQEYIPARVDLRITVIGEEIFPAAIHSQETAYAVDFRMDMTNARMEATRLPAEVERGLRTLMTRLGLVYGAIDMRLTPDGRYVFLEVNTAGQFLFVEDATGMPISAALARLLAARDA